MMTGVRAFWFGDGTQVASGLCCTGAVAVQAEQAVDGGAGVIQVGQGLEQGCNPHRSLQPGFLQ